ncbi:N-formylglutamate amidohydrolase [Cellulophaga sp. F20128]|uniref:N-formylglutamate amidohydrolase n=1 Tax=Cellulophaga sp. F20128 TaxID=2926413 RepID=UPI001FF491F1|nr:N-formylglutamate amidohydrolase [Cellulophaga sp. F20128]MCK0158523.1 N-formylglutamate amidohydrolase [Cellulophaga sp. F20128]
MTLLLTCEHGGNHIPNNYRSYFKNKDAVLNSHRGYDLGALHLFSVLKEIASYSKYSTTSRLVIELNRSLHHKHLFSAYTKSLSNTAKEQLIKEYYTRYREEVTAEIKKRITAQEFVLHIAVHSFTPILNGTERNCDIGLLFDSTKPNEKDFCRHFKQEIKKLDATINVRYNYPYLGKSDGFPTFLRKLFPKNYIGIELEVNQKFSNQNKFPNHLNETLLNALKEVLFLK